MGMRRVAVESTSSSSELLSFRGRVQLVRPIGSYLVMDIENKKRTARWNLVSSPITPFIRGGDTLEGFYDPTESGYFDLRALQVLDEDKKPIYRDISRMGHQWVYEYEMPIKFNENRLRQRTALTKKLGLELIDRVKMENGWITNWRYERYRTFLYVNSHERIVKFKGSDDGIDRLDKEFQLLMGSLEESEIKLGDSQRVA